MKNNKYLVIIGLLVILLVIWIIYKNNNKNFIATKIENTYKTNEQTKDTSIAVNNENNINLEIANNLKKYEKYKNLPDFLKDKQKELTWINLDLSKDDFVVCIKWKNNSKIYIPIYQDEIKKWYYNTWSVLYSYMSYIDNWIKNNCIYWGKNSFAESKIIFERDVRNRFHKVIDDIFNRRENV